MYFVRLRASFIKQLISCFDLDVQVWDKAAAAFGSEKDVVVAKVDADAHKDLGERHVQITLTSGKS